MEAKSGITVIIPAHNEIRWIGKTLRSIRRQTLHPDAVVVTDDFSSDGTGEYIKALFPEVVVIRPDRNLGSKARAQNFALFYKRPNGDFLIKNPMVITIDADTTLDQTAIEEL
ncbi:MAG: glycosyltransferase, partial [candidate division WWE3 bacterium]|nr:glycosyltransferase [candidate division WWE3 bacterium]